MFKNKEVIVRLKDKRYLELLLELILKNLIIRYKTKIVRIDCERIIEIKQYE